MKKIKNKRKKVATEYSLDCNCGSKAIVFETEKGYMAHCPNCGGLSFFENPMLLQRLNYGGKLCPHEPEKKECRGGHTSWCSICRIRSFFYDK
jgi:transcription elongation factor Elf1